MVMMISWPLELGEEWFSGDYSNLGGFDSFRVTDYVLGKPKHKPDDT
jgi:hypothetical protein